MHTHWCSSQVRAAAAAAAAAAATCCAARSAVRILRRLRVHRADVVHPIVRTCSIVFAGFSADSLRDRIMDARSKWVVTADEGKRGGRTIPLKQTTDVAVAQCPCVERVFVYQRTGADVPMGLHDVSMTTALKSARGYHPAVSMDSEDPMFLLYTSGSTGKPKGVAHTTAGYLLFASLTHKYAFDCRPGDVYACVADCGWITGHSYIVYGPLCNGVTTLMFESTPMYPTTSRYWEVVEKHRVTQFYTAPTA
ncbi:hypothetical protein EON62_02170, partial [archaeon]